MLLAQQISFEVGEVVILKSGGPDMTVVNHLNGFVTTFWFSDSYTVEEHTFPQECLTKVN